MTFTADLGSKTLGDRLTAVFESIFDLHTYDFAPKSGETLSDPRLDYAYEVMRRSKAAVGLSDAVVRARREGRTIVFQGVSPALYSYPAAPKGRYFILTDWTRKLYEPVRNVRQSSAALTYVHSKVLRSTQKVLGLTDSVIDAIVRDYGVEKAQVVKVPAPFDVATFSSAADACVSSGDDRNQDHPVRLLFIGGDFKRKGGDVVMDWFSKLDQPIASLTVVTRSKVDVAPGVNVFRAVEYGSPEHLELLSSHDVLVLPTSYDAYPMVLGEAASAGLAVVTTRFALGAREVIRHGWNGYIEPSADRVVSRVGELLMNRSLLNTMKLRSRQHMRTHFNENLIAESLEEALFR